MSSHRERLDEVLDALDESSRRRLARWHALRLAERRPLLERSLRAEGAALVEGLVEAGSLARSSSRSLLPWRRGQVLALTAAGRTSLEAKRAELEQRQELIRGSFEAGWEALVGAGVDPAEFYLERMLLAHGRFRDRPVGFPENDVRLSRVVREVEQDSRIRDEDDGLSAAFALGLFSNLD